MKHIRKNTFYIFTLCFLVLSGSVYAQIDNPTLSFNRGQLWQSVYYGKIGPVFGNWGKKGIGLDWPGFDESWIKVNIGGSPSHLATGGFWVGSKKSPDSILAVEDWSIYAGTISNDQGAKYKITQHHHKYKNGDNYWLKTNPKEGEEVIETSWEYNANYTNVDDRDHQLPVRVTRVAHNWSGSRKDENYIIYEYTIKNISPEIRKIDPDRYVADTLYDFYMLLSYAMHVNSRSWGILFPALTPGARNTEFHYDLARNMIWGKSCDYSETTANEAYGFVASQGMQLDNGDVTGEWTAPGFVGVKLLYSSPDNTSASTRVNQYGWSAGLSSIDQSGPFNGIPGTIEAKYNVLKDISNAASFVASEADNVYMKKSRMWSMMSFGPWTILPGDSIVVAVAEIVNGIDYKDALNKSLGANLIGGIGAAGIPGTNRNAGGYLFNASADRAQFTYDHYRDPNTGALTGNGLNHPDPPAAPKFTVDFFKGSQKIAANVIKWGKECEAQADPDDGSFDLAGYKIYRSGFLPIGPWDSVAVVMKGDPNYFSLADGKYTFIDSTSKVGSSYYYSITAFDTGKAKWNIDPAAVFKETRSVMVPPMESSIFANRMVQPFTTTFPPASTTNDILVVPNPFVLKDNYASTGVPGSDSEIQFVNIPNPCTIRIYTVRGDLVKTIRVSEGNGAITSWDQTTDFGQFAASGIYIYHVESKNGSKIGKFAIVK
jgi:hypothetical protein